MGAAACLQQILIVGRLPKTRSAKILRKSLPQIAENQDFMVSSTIDDPSSIDEIKVIMQNNGLVKTST